MLPPRDRICQLIQPNCWCVCKQGNDSIIGIFLPPEIARCHLKSVATFLSQIQYFIKAHIQQAISIFLRILQMCFFSLELQPLLRFQQFCEFFLNKSCKKYLGPMLPPCYRIWQLIQPNCSCARACVCVIKVMRVDWGCFTQ